MPATAARAAFIKEEYRTVNNGPDSGVVTKYGDLARKSKEAIPTFFETEADAQAMCDERMTLLSADRRRFQQTISGEATGLGVSYILGSPTVRIIDDDRDALHLSIISELTIDFTNETTRIETWGGDLDNIEGFVYLSDEDGALLIDADNSYILEAI